MWGCGYLVTRAFERYSSFRGVECLGIELQTQAICQPRQVVEYPDDVRHLQAGLVIEAKVAQWLPVPLHHARRRCRQLLGHRCESVLPRSQALYITPALVLDSLRKFEIIVLNTEELGV